MKQNLRFDRVEGNSIYYVNPLHPTDRLRFGTKVSSKFLTDGTKVPSVSATIAQVRIKNVDNCSKDCVAPRETTGIRLELNSSLANKAVLRSELVVFFENVLASIDSGLLDGLKPSITETFTMWEPDVEPKP